MRDRRIFAPLNKYVGRINIDIFVKLPEKSTRSTTRSKISLIERSSLQKNVSNETHLANLIYFTLCFWSESIWYTDTFFQVHPYPSIFWLIGTFWSKACIIKCTYHFCRYLNPPHVMKLIHTSSNSNTHWF